MADGIRTRGAGVLFARLGSPNRRPQGRWARAPQAHGTWAFPWPMFDMFFAWHQYELAMPKRLRSGEYPLPFAHPSAYLLDGEPATRLPTAQEWLELDRWEVREGIYDEISEWVRTTGPRAVPMRRFWYDGDVYTHLTLDGQVLMSDQWCRMPARAFAEALARSGGRHAMYRTPDGVLRRVRCSVDHMEVFIPGKVR